MRQMIFFIFLPLSYVETYPFKKRRIRNKADIFLEKFFIDCFGMVQIYDVFTILDKYRCDFFLLTSHHITNFPLEFVFDSISNVPIIFYSSFKKKIQQIFGFVKLTNSKCKQWQNVKFQNQCILCTSVRCRQMIDIL